MTPRARMRYPTRRALLYALHQVRLTDQRIEHAAQRRIQSETHHVTGIRAEQVFRAARVAAGLRLAAELGHVAGFRPIGQVLAVGHDIEKADPHHFSRFAFAAQRDHVGTESGDLRRFGHFALQFPPQPFHLLYGRQLDSGPQLLDQRGEKFRSFRVLHVRERVLEIGTRITRDLLGDAEQFLERAQPLVAGLHQRRDAALVLAVFVLQALTAAFLGRLLGVRLVKQSLLLSASLSELLLAAAHFVVVANGTLLDQVQQFIQRQRFLRLQGQSQQQAQRGAGNSSCHRHLSGLRRRNRQHQQIRGNLL